ncbi:MAG: RagB/SusD family nutrient uptake outer membrane protein [Bacteroidales bacterium]|nr:RagB/SusD family nutrient uptake outer membrane protein [Bacteroidales bacterium]
MKNNIKLSAMALALATIGFSACSEDFLEVENPTQLSLEEYFSDPEKLQSSVTAAYAPLHWFDYNAHKDCSYADPTFIADILSDQVFIGGGSSTDQPPLQRINNWASDAQNTPVSLWDDCYSGVKRCNDCLGYLESFTGSNKNQLIAEIYTLRAYYYNILWKFWGNIPYYDGTEEFPSPSVDNGYTAVQLSPADSYAQIIKYLELAINEPTFPSTQKSGEEGHATKAFAKMLYADYVLYQKDNSKYATALGYMDDVIAEYPLESDYSKIFTEAGEWCSESIFEINYAKVGTRDWYDNDRVAAGTVLPAFLGPAEEIPGVCNSGWGFGAIKVSVWDLFTDGDKRRDASIIDARGIASSGRYQCTFLYNGKYAPRAENLAASGDPNLSYGNNRRVFRSAEAYLDAAELSAKLGNGKEGLYLNALREARGGSYTGSSLADIVEEAAREFVGEGKRFFILMRNDGEQGINASQILVGAAHDNSGKYTYTSEQLAQNGKFAEHNKYLAIPQEEISADKNLKQNPGY